MSKIRIVFKKPYAIELNSEVDSIEFDIKDIQSVSYEVIPK